LQLNSLSRLEFVDIFIFYQHTEELNGNTEFHICKYIVFVKILN